MRSTGQRSASGADPAFLRGRGPKFEIIKHFSVLKYEHRAGQYLAQRGKGGGGGEHYFFFFFFFCPRKFENRAGQYLAQ